MLRRGKHHGAKLCRWVLPPVIERSRNERCPSERLARETVAGVEGMRQVIDEIEVVWQGVLDRPPIPGIFLGSGGRKRPETALLVS
jgi:hypothetical protein